MKIKEFLLLPFMIIPILAYMTSTYKDRLEKDIDRFWSIHFGHKPKSYISGLIRELRFCPEFRNLFFYRCGAIGRALSHFSIFFLKKQVLLSFGVPRAKMGGVFLSSMDIAL